MDINELKHALAGIKRRGYVASLRRGNTGIGYTLETLLGVRENNLALPDLGEIELKAHRRGASSLITLFTFNRGAWKIPQADVVNAYGYEDTTGRQALYCIVSSSPNNQGFYLRIVGDGIWLRHVNGASIAQWSGQTLIRRFAEKMPALVFVQADARENSSNREEFWFDEAHLLTNPNVHNFLDLIGNDRIRIDLRMHLRPNGSVRNHGTGFRIDERYLSLCFGNRERLI